MISKMMAGVEDCALFLSNVPRVLGMVVVGVLTLPVMSLLLVLLENFGRHGDQITPEESSDRDKFDATVSWKSV